MSATDATAGTGPVSLPREGRLAVGLVGITFVGAMISSLGAPLIPDIATSTGSTLTQAQWTLTLTVLVAVAATPVMGRLSDTKYRKPTILVALALVALGGVIAASSTNSLPMLLVGRGLQGFGQGLAPMMIGVAHSALTGSRKQSTIGLLSITNAAGVGLGYPITGLLAQWAGISGAFWIGGALTSLIALAIAIRVVPKNHRTTNNAVDLLGAGLFALAIGGLLLALAEGNEWGWTSVSTIALIVLSIAIGAIWVRHQLRTASPLVDVRMLRHRSVLAADVTVLLGGIGMYLLLTLTTRLVQAPERTGGLGRDAIVAGLVMVPLSAGSLGATWVARWLRPRLKESLLLPVSATLMVVAMTIFALTRHHLGGLLIAMAMAGVGIGLVFALVPTFIVGHVPQGDTGSALSFNQIFRYVGYSMGSVLTATVLQTGTTNGSALPSDVAYTDAALTGIGVWLLTGIFSAISMRKRNLSTTRGESA